MITDKKCFRKVFYKIFPNLDWLFIIIAIPVVRIFQTKFSENDTETFSTVNMCLKKIFLSVFCFNRLNFLL